jgi:uncharacterized protein (DUF697 family)
MPKSLADAEKHAKSLVNKWAVVAGTVGVVPGSTLLLAGADVKIVHDIAKAFEVESYTVEEVLTVIGASIAGKTAADYGLSWFPGIGWLIKGGIAAITTKTAGAIMIKYFKGKSELV